MLIFESLVVIVEFFAIPLLFGILFYLLISRISRSELNCISPTPAIEKYDRTEYIPEKLIFPLSYFLVSTVGIPTIISIYLGLKFGIRAFLPYVVFGSILISFALNYISLLVSLKNEGKDLVSILRKYAGERVGKIFFIFTAINLLALFSVLLEAIPEIFIKYPQILYSVAISLILYTILGIIQKASQIFLGISILTSVLVFALSFLLGQIIYQNIPYSDKILSKEIIQTVITLYILTISLIPYWGGTKIKSTSHLISLTIIILTGCILTTKIILDDPKNFTDKILKPGVQNDYQNDIFPSMLILAISTSWGGFNSIILSSIVSKRIRSYCNIPTISFSGAMVGMVFSIVAIIISVSLSDLPNQSSAERFSLSFISAFFESLPYNLRYKVIEEFLAYSFISFTILSQETIGRSLRLISKESLIPEIVKENNEIKRKIKFLKVEILAIPIAMVFFFFEKEKTDKMWILFGTSGYIVLLLSSLTSYIFLRKDKPSTLNRTLKLSSIFLIIFSSLVIFSFLVEGIKNYEGITMIFPTIALILILYVISAIVRVIRMKES